MRLPHISVSRSSCRHASSSIKHADPSALPTARPRPKTALFFPGQGVQRVGMTDSWVTAFPQIAKPFLEEVDSTLDTPLSTIMASGPNSQLTATENAQPAIMATSVLILRILEQHFGFKTRDTVHFTLGHSLGEFAALVAGGYIPTFAALDLVRKRAQVMASASRDATPNPDSLGMVALVCEADQRDNMISAIRAYLTTKYDNNSKGAHPAITIANINSKNQIVLSGDLAHIKALLANIREFGGHDPRAVRLSSDSPFHSPMMQPATALMRDLLSKTRVTFPGHFPCISNLTARPFADVDRLKDLLARQAAETVLWHDSIQYLHRTERVRRWIGIGPGKVGRNLVGKEVGMKGAVKGGGVWGINEPGDVEGVLRALEETERFVEEDDEGQGAVPLDDG